MVHNMDYKSLHPRAYPKPSQHQNLLRLGVVAPRRAKVYQRLTGNRLASVCFRGLGDFVEFLLQIRSARRCLFEVSQCLLNN
jgi:hypothetical protein